VSARPQGAVCVSSSAVNVDPRPGPIIAQMRGSTQRVSLNLYLQALQSKAPSLKRDNSGDCPSVDISLPLPAHPNPDEKIDCPDQMRMLATAARWEPAGCGGVRIRSSPRPIPLPAGRVAVHAATADAAVRRPPNSAASSLAR